MLEPMIARLAGCLIFASLFGGLLFVASASRENAPRDAVQVAELQKSVEKILFTRP